MTDGRPLNVLLVGDEAAGVQALRVVASGPHHLVGVMTSPPQTPKDSGLWNSALRMGFEPIPGHQIREPGFEAQLAYRDVDVLLNVHSLHIIPADVLRACRIGAFNLHPGPLPEYAGLDVPSWAIYNGETSHGVTLHDMAPQVDAGDVIYRAHFEILPSDTGLTLMSKCVRTGIPLLRQLLTTLYRDPAGLPRLQQDLSRRRYFSRRPPNGGRIDWNRPAVAVLAHIRAADYAPFASPWGAPRCTAGDAEFGIVKAALTGLRADASPGTVTHISDDGAFVCTADDLLLVKSVARADSRPVSATDVLRPGQVLLSDAADSLVC